MPKGKQHQTRSLRMMLSNHPCEGYYLCGGTTPFGKLTDIHGWPRTPVWVLSSKRKVNCYIPSACFKRRAEGFVAFTSSAVKENRLL